MTIYIIDSLKQYGSFIISIIALCIAIFSLISFSGQITNINAMQNNYKNNFQTSFDLLNENISSIYDSINRLGDTDNNINARINGLDNSFNSLNNQYGTLANNIGNMQGRLDEITVKINNLSDAFNNTLSTVMSGSFDVNLTMTYYPNQTGTVYYGILSFQVTPKTSSILKDTRFGIFIEKTNISFYSWYGLSIPMESQGSNGTYNDNYYLYWFGTNANYTAVFNISWDNTDYNATNLPLSKIISTIAVNDVFVNTPQIWRVEL